MLASFGIAIILHSATFGLWKVASVLETDKHLELFLILRPMNELLQKNYLLIFRERGREGESGRGTDVERRNIIGCL